MAMTLRDAAAEVARILRSDDPGQVQEGALDRLEAALSAEQAGWRESFIADEEGGPVAGVLIDLPDGSQIWTGECSQALLDEAASRDEAPDESGMFLMIGRNDGSPTRVVAQVATVDDGIGLARAIASCHAPARPTPAEQELEAACGICDLALVEGDRCLTDVDLGPVHAACCGPERESYVGPDGEPLKPGEPLPTPWIWTDEPRATPAAHPAAAGEPELVDWFGQYVDRYVEETNGPDAGALIAVLDRVRDSYRREAEAKAATHG